MTQTLVMISFLGYASPMSTHTHTLDLALDWDEPQFGVLRACSAIHCSTQWLNTMFNRKPVVYPLLPDERVAVGGRNYFILSFRRVFHLALIRRLGDVMLLAAARDLSRAVVDSDELWPADMLPGGPARYLVIAPASGLAKILIADQDAPALPPEAIADVGEDPREPRIVLNATEVFDRVVEALDVHKAMGELVEDEEEFDRFLLTAERWPPRTGEIAGD